MMTTLSVLLGVEMGDSNDMEVDEQPPSKTESPPPQPKKVDPDEDLPAEKKAVRRCLCYY